MDARLVIRGKRRLRYGLKRKYMWQFIASNNRVLCHDGRQDYNNSADAAAMASRILDGEFKDKYKVSYVVDQ